MNDLRDFLGSKVPPSVDIGGEKPDFTEVDIGYIEPGHGLKGRKEWINIDDDVDSRENGYYVVGILLCFNIQQELWQKNW